MEVEDCVSPVALVFVDFVALFLAWKSALFLGVCFVDATGGELSPTILLPVPVLDTLVKGGKNCLAFSETAMWLQSDALFWWTKQSIFFYTVLVLKSVWLSLEQE